MKDIELPSYVRKYGGKYYCWLEGEMDKDEYDKQCSKCPVQSRCTLKRTVLKDVAGDWHSLNAEGFFGAEFTECKDKFKKKELRGLSKIGGLLLTYGGSAWSIAYNFNCTVESAQTNVDNFFRKLTTLSVYMTGVTNTVLQTGMVYNLFGRQRDVSSDSTALPRDMPSKEKFKRQGYAKRTALNHPIQSTAAEFLKLGSLRADHIIRENNWSPYALDYLPMEYESDDLPSYKDFKAHLISSVHDELMYLMRGDSFEEIIPRIYIAMQLSDIMEIFNIGFTLELDCEFDVTRSWTAGKRFDSARIYMLREVGGLSAVGGLPVATVRSEGSGEHRDNLALVRMEDVTPAIIQKLKDMTQELEED